MGWVGLEGILKILQLHPNTFHCPTWTFPGMRNPQPLWKFLFFFLTLVETFPCKFFVPRSGFDSSPKAAELRELHNSFLNPLLVAGWNFPRGWERSKCPSDHSQCLDTILEGWNEWWLPVRIVPCPHPLLSTNPAGFKDFILQTCLALLKWSLSMLFMALEEQRGTNKTKQKDERSCNFFLI